MTPSGALADALAQAGVGRARVVPSATWPEPSAREGPPARAKFVFCGRLTAAKGVHTLLDAIAMCKEGAELKILGRGPLEEQLRRRVHSERLPVTLGGFADAAGVRSELRRATAAVFPSRWVENCPLGRSAGMVHSRSPRPVRSRSRAMRRGGGSRSNSFTR